MPPTAEILRRLVVRNGLLIVTALLGAGAGWLYAAIRPPTYDASAYVVLTPAGSSVPDSTAVSFAQAFGRITAQDGVLRIALPILGEGSEDSLRRAIRVSTSPDAPLIRVTGSAGTAQLAAARANAVATALINYGNQRTVRTRVRLDSFAEAAPPPDPTSPRPALDTAVGAAAGLLVGGLAVAAGAGRRTGTGRPAGAAGAGGGAPAGAEPPADGRYQWAIPVRYLRNSTGNGAEPAPASAPEKAPKKAPEKAAAGAGEGSAGDGPAPKGAGAADGTAGDAGPAGEPAEDGVGPSDQPDVPKGDAWTVPITTGAGADRKPGPGRGTGRP
jgi:capsular polysaccharide biosynthesis protein